MKKIFFAALLLPMLLAVSCSKDNFKEPEETFYGKFVVKGTGEPFETAMGNTGIRIRMMEYSWSENPQPYDFYAKMDGTFQNTKIFEGEYGVKPSGAFVELPEEKIVIKGVVEKTWEVEPFLNVQWVGEPVVNADGTVDVQVKITRGTQNPDYQQPLAEAWLFVSETDYVGDFSYSPIYSTRISGAAINQFEFGKTYTIRTGQPGGFNPAGAHTAFPTYARKYFLRVGARTSKQFDGTNRYNYTTIKEITTNNR